jgi:plasmid maintenance system antidote protein VapI
MAYTRDQINSAFGKVLKGVVKENDQTQQSVADHLGQSVATINRIFGGKREITVAQFIAITELCGEDPQMIVFRVMAKLSQMSVTPANVVPLATKRPSMMTDEEIDQLQGAANDDEENVRDEPDPT